MLDAWAGRSYVEAALAVTAAQRSQFKLPDTLVITRSLHLDHEPDDAVEQDTIPSVHLTSAAQHALDIRDRIVRRRPQQLLDQNAEVFGQPGDNR